MPPWAPIAVGTPTCRSLIPCCKSLATVDVTLTRWTSRLGNTRDMPGIHFELFYNGDPKATFCFATNARDLLQCMSPVMARTRSAGTARERRLSGVKRKKYAQDEFFSS